MACNKPVEIFYNVKTQKHQFSYTLDCIKKPILVDCNKCEACQLKFITQLGLRATHELMYHSKSMFITLTVDNNHIDEVFPNGELHHKAFQLFMKKFRNWLKRVKYKNNPEDCPTISYIMCGEYGENYGRPHYHAVIFGYEFDDMIDHHVKGGISGLKRSPQLEKLWDKGFSTVSMVNYQKCTYLAKYVAKARGEDKKNYERLDISTGEITYKKKPYLVYPKQGLGKNYFMDNYKAILRKGYFTLRPKKYQQNGFNKKSNIENLPKIGLPRSYKIWAERYFGKEYIEYRQNMEIQVESANTDYIFKKFISGKNDYKNVLLMAELTGMDKSQIVNTLLYSEFTDNDILHQKRIEGLQREKAIKKFNRNNNKVHAHV